jgi:sugar phosphate isomerase/epimerase
MKLLFTKSKWEAPALSVEAFLDACLRDGFDGTELHLQGLPETPAEIARLHAGRRLIMVGQIVTEGTTPAEHAASLERLYLQACAAGAVFVSSHTGKDFFPHEENLRIFAKGLELEAAHGIPLVHETHRGRALFTAHGTARYLRELPSLALTADFSHWFCVHESDLRDQEESLAAAIAATRHVHARVGFGEGPQVAQPAAPGFSGWLDRHVGLWRRIVAARGLSGAPMLTITPEAGPPPYMPVDPATGSPLADAWAVNVWMKRYLAGILAESGPDPAPTPPAPARSTFST